MSSEPLCMSLDNATAIWSIVEKQLDAFCQAWEAAPSEAGQPPALAEFVGDYDPAVRRLILVDLVKVDLEYRSQNLDWVQPIEFYVDAWPELCTHGVVPAELLYEEIYHRRLNGLEVDLADYQRRFPESSDALKRLLGVDQSGMTSTGLSQGARNITDYQVGDTVDDFELRVELGRGAFGVVFLAIQKSMQRMVALKVSANRGTEAQVLAQLEHPNIVRVYDRRVLEEQDIQLFYMQYVRGGTLQGALQYVRAHSHSEWCGKLILEAIDKSLDNHGEVIPAPTPARLSLAQSDWLKATCDLGIQLASALDYSHQKNTLHRDVKPANILLTVDGTAKLADFNISCNSKVDGASPAAYFGGSLAYMSPEQLEAYNPLHERQPESLDGRSDIYSTAVVIWEILTGSRPFREERFSDTWENTLEEMTARRKMGLTDEEWSQLPSNCPSSLRLLFEKALAPAPEKRFECAAEMIRPLRMASNETGDEVPWQSRLSKFARAHSFIVLMLASVIPNALAAGFVFVYNGVQSLQDMESDAFWWAQAIINGVFFPLGALLVIRFAWPLGRTMRARARGETIAKEDQMIARNRSLNLGRLVFLIGLTLWICAGVIYPVLLRNSINQSAIIHFFLSHVLGGLFAGAYPFFLLTYVGLSAWYPPFLEIGLDDDGIEAKLLDRTQKTATFADIVGAALPMFSVMLLVFVTGQEEDKRELHQRMLVTATVASFVGFGFVYWLSRNIGRRINELRSILSPEEAVTRRR